MSDLSSQFRLFSSKLEEEFQHHQAEYDRWHNYKRDYEALERQLSTLPDTVSKQAMIPMGPLAFMPGKIIHTNEILVLLGDKYYAERTAKQAMDIVGRRKEVVEESLRLVEAQLNSVKAKRMSVLDSMQQTQYNEEGLPIMDIREELPADTAKEEKDEKARLIQDTTPPSSSSAEGSSLPESVLRARRMMKEADEKLKQEKDANRSQEDKALFDLLQELEEEEEELEAAGINNVIEKPPIYTKFMDAAKEEEEGSKRKAASGSASDESSDDDQDDFDEDDERYDKEIADNLFDKFSDNPLEGVVDQEDFTTYDEEHTEDEDEDENIRTMTSSVKEMFIEHAQRKKEPMNKVSEKGFNATESDADDAERSTPKLGPKKKNQKKKVTFAASVQPTQEELDEEDEPERGKNTAVQRRIKSPADIFKVIHKTQNSNSVSNVKGDDYPSLDDINNQDESPENVDINDLLQAARGYATEAIYRPADASETLIPIVKENFQDTPDPSSEAADSSSKGKQKASSSKLDNKIMKGAVMENDIEPVDPEAVEEDMDLREITTSYQQKRLNMLAATGGFSFEPKPEFEVFDEELPLPKKEHDNKGTTQDKDDIPEVKPKKKISRFKAARLGMRMDDGSI